MYDRADGWKPLVSCSHAKISEKYIPCKFSFAFQMAETAKL